MIEDTFRVLSIGFSYLDGAESIDEYLSNRGRPEFSYVIYRNLGDLYLGKERYVDAAEAYEASVKQDPNHSKSPLMKECDQIFVLLDCFGQYLHKTME